MRPVYLSLCLWCALVIGLTPITGCEREPSSAPASVITPQVASGDSSTIVVDTQHELHERGAAGQPYLLQAAEGLVINATSHALQDPQRRARIPNTIQIIYGSSLFTADWPISGRQVSTLDRSTLKLVRGNAFEGFRPATQAYIAIGHVEAAGNGAEPQFTPFWMTSVVFR